MSRSKRKQPFTGISTSDSDKTFKQITSRLHRRAEKEALHHSGENDALLPLKREQLQWGNKDGKQRFDPAKHPEYLRK